MKKYLGTIILVAIILVLVVLSRQEIHPDYQSGNNEPELMAGMG